MNVYVSDEILSKLIKWGFEPKKWVKETLDNAVKAEEAKRNGS